MEAETYTRQFLRIFYDGKPVPRDQIQKSLRGTGMTSNDFLDNRWCYENDKIFYVVDPLEFAKSYKGVKRNQIGKDLDQALILIGACFENSGIRLLDTLNNPNFKPHPALPSLLKWFFVHTDNDEVKRSAYTASGIYNDWLSKAENKEKVQEQQMLFGME